jgi:hypothetical protein
MPKYDALCPMHQRRLITAWSVQLPGLVPSRNTSAEDVFRCSLITLLRAYEMSCFGEASITVLGGGITFGNQTARSSVSPDSEHSTMRGWLSVCRGRIVLIDHQAPRS